MFFINNKIAVIFILLCTFISESAIRVTLKNGNVIEGEKISENINFIVVSRNNSKISILKKSIKSTENIILQYPKKKKRLQPVSATIHADTTKSDNKKIVKSQKKKSPQTLEDLLNKNKNAIFLDMSFRNLKKIPRDINTLKKLKYLDLKGNKLKTLPAEIGDLSHLEDLDLRFNDISVLPPEITNLTGLKRIWLTGTKLTEKQINQLKTLLPYTAIVYFGKKSKYYKAIKENPLSEKQKIIEYDLWEGCSHGVSKSCNELFKIYEKLQDMEKCLISAKIGCDIGSNNKSKESLNCCKNVADIYDYKIKDIVQAHKYYKYICKLKSAYSKTACEKANLVK